MEAAGENAGEREDGWRACFVARCGEAVRGTVAYFSGWGPKNGIKMALAGTLALYFALWMRLDEPTWAVTTAFVLSTPKFVGAILEKTVFRIFGALLGAVTGYTITGGLEQNPVLFLGAVGGFVALTTALYGGAFAPYFFRQWGYTATIVAAQGMADPEFSWKVGLARCEEICLGIVVATAVTMVVWPRYARVEFAEGARSTLGKLRDFLRKRAEGFLSGEGKAGPGVFLATGGSLEKLRKLIRVASFESREFRRMRGEIDAIVSQLGVLIGSVSGLSQSLPSESILRKYIEEPVAALHQNLIEAFDLLADKKSKLEERGEVLGRVGESLEKYAASLKKFRLDGGGDELPPEESLSHAGYSLAIREIYGSLQRLSELLETLDRSQGQGMPAIGLRSPTIPSKGWILSGIRGGIAVASGLLILNWFHPPGGEMIVIGTYLFTAFTLESADRRGDLGVFGDLFRLTVALLCFFVFLLFWSPFMANYAVFNTVLAGALFLVGYFLEKGLLGSFQSLFCLLLVVNLVGINAQRPVPFEEVAGVVFGIFLALVLSATIRRLLWPILPQNQFRQKVLHLIDFLEKAAAEKSLAGGAKEKAEFVLSVSEAHSLAAVLGREVLGEREVQNLGAYIRHLGEIGWYLTSFPWGVLDGLPGGLREEIGGKLAGLHEALLARLSEQRRGILSGGTLGVADGGSGGADFLLWAQEARQKIRGARLGVPETVAAVGVLHHAYGMAKEAEFSGLGPGEIDWRDVFSDKIL